MFGWPKLKGNTVAECIENRKKKLQSLWAGRQTNKSTDDINNNNNNNSSNSMKCYSHRWLRHRKLYMRGIWWYVSLTSSVELKMRLTNSMSHSKLKPYERKCTANITFHLLLPFYSLDCSLSLCCTHDIIFVFLLFGCGLVNIEDFLLACSKCVSAIKLHFNYTKWLWNSVGT